MILLACPHCARQYDVSHLTPDTPIRCLCDRVFPAEVPKARTADALRCSACGGSTSSGDVKCSYCGALLARTMPCPKCYTRIEEDSRHCRACGTKIEPQALTPVPDGRDCPRCQGALRSRDLGGASVIECEACEGMWVGTDAFEAICHHAERRPEAGSLFAQAPDQVPWERNVTYIPCLSCSELMMRRQFRQAGRGAGVVIDLCRDHGVWLDSDELARIVSFLATLPAGADRGLGPGYRRVASPAERDALPATVEGPPSRALQALELLGDILSSFF